MYIIGNCFLSDTFSKSIINISLYTHTHSVFDKKLIIFCRKLIKKYLLQVFLTSRSYLNTLICRIRGINWYTKIVKINLNLQRALTYFFKTLVTFRKHEWSVSSLWLLVFTVRSINLDQLHWRITQLLCFLNAPNIN